MRTKEVITDTDKIALIKVTKDGTEKEIYGFLINPNPVLINNPYIYKYIEYNFHFIKQTTLKDLRSELNRPVIQFLVYAKIEDYHQVITFFEKYR